MFIVPLTTILFLLEGSNLGGHIQYLNDLAPNSDLYVVPDNLIA